MWYARWNRDGRAGSEVEALPAGQNRKPSLQDDEALLLRMRVQRRRCMVRKEELTKAKRPSQAPPGTRIVARVPRNQSRSPSPAPDQLAPGALNPG